MISHSRRACAREKSADKTLVRLEGAMDPFGPCCRDALGKGPPINAYGNTIKTRLEHIDTRLAKPGRFQWRCGTEQAEGQQR